MKWNETFCRNRKKFQKKREIGGAGALVFDFRLTEKAVTRSLKVKYACGV